MNWLRIKVPFGVASSQLSERLQIVVASAHLASRGAPGVAMLAEHESGDEFETFYFSPAAVRLVGSSLEDEGAAPSGPPDGTKPVSLMYGDRSEFGDRYSDLK